MTEPELRERVELVLRAAQGRFMQDNEDSQAAIITALEGMKWALDLDPEGTPEDMRQILERWAEHK